MTGMTASITINGDVTDHLLQELSARTHTHTRTYHILFVPNISLVLMHTHVSTS